MRHTESWKEKKNSRTFRELHMSRCFKARDFSHDTYVYGVDAKRTLSTIMNPTEVMDGAIVSGNCVSACDKNPTYVHENNPVVHDLFEEHGKH